MNYCPEYIDIYHGASLGPGLPIGDVLYSKNILFCESQAWHGSSLGGSN